MTHEETIKRIQELVPSVMELQEGCSVRCFEIDFGYFNQEDFIRTYHLNFGPKKAYDEKGELIAYEDGYYFDNINTLGKPITLAVVLLAIDTKYTEWKNPDTPVAINSKGEFQVWSENPVYKNVFWNLSEDDFNAQSEKTKTFIGGLLTT